MTSNRRELDVLDAAAIRFVRWMKVGMQEDTASCLLDPTTGHIVYSYADILAVDARRIPLPA